MSKMKIKYAKQQNVRTYSVGESVSVKVPRIDRTCTDLPRIPCVVVQRVGKAQELYRLRCKSGVLSNCFSAGDLEPFRGEFHITVDDWEDQPQVTLRSASMEQSACNVFTRNRCNCRSCDNRRCCCRKANIACSTHCHKGKDCSNKHALYEDKKKDSPQAKKEASEPKNWEHDGSSSCPDRDSETWKSEPNRCRCRKGCHSKRSCPCKMKGALCTNSCHPQRPCTNIATPENASANVNIVDEEDVTLSSSSSSKAEPKLWQNCRGIKLLETHRKVIQEGEWLCDEIVNACQLLLKDQYPIIRGFQSTLLADTYGMDPQPSAEFVQIVNVNRNHWILISTVNCPPSTVDVYDSMHLSLSMRLKKLVADLLQAPSKEITIRYRDVQWQSGGSDCGIFAVAFATSICNGIDPVTVTFTQSRMRSHLVLCIEKKFLSMFPYKHRAWKPTTKTSRTEMLPIFCTCRLPDDGATMVECSACSEWYHVACIPPFEIDADWFCIKCA